MTDSWSQRIIYGGMADGALDSHRSQASGMVKESGETHDSVQLQQRDGHRRILEIDLSCLESTDKGLWQRILIHFQSHREGGLRTNAGPHPSKLFSFDCLMNLERTAPIVLVSERVVTKCVAAAIDHTECMEIHSAITVLVIRSRDVRRMLQEKTDKDCGDTEGADQHWTNPVHSNFLH